MVILFLRWKGLFYGGQSLQDWLYVEAEMLSFCEFKKKNSEKKRENN